jgi:hypothetical protein
MRGFLGLVTVGMTLVAAGTAGAAELAWRGVYVRVYDNADVPKVALRTALAVAVEALRPADVEVEWVPCSTSSGGRCTQPLGPGEVILRLVRLPLTEPVTGDESLGTALLDPATGTGVLATVYVDRVERLARDSRGDLAALLGRAIAHEIGHLLTGRAAHSGAGLMRPRWTRAEVARNARADWSFGEGDLRGIRAWADRVYEARRASSAVFTLAGVNGISRSRAPVASNTALPMAAATAVIDVSPAPLASAAGWGTSTVSTTGVRVPTANVR